MLYELDQPEFICEHFKFMLIFAQIDHQYSSLNGYMDQFGCLNQFILLLGSQVLKLLA